MGRRAGCRPCERRRSRSQHVRNAAMADLDPRSHARSSSRSFDSCSSSAAGRSPLANGDQPPPPASGLRTELGGTYGYATNRHGVVPDAATEIIDMVVDTIVAHPATAGRYIPMATHRRADAPPVQRGSAARRPLRDVSECVRARCGFRGGPRSPARHSRYHDARLAAR